MPQVRKDTFTAVISELRSLGVPVTREVVRVGDLRGIQHDVNPDKVKSIAARIAQHGLESLSPMLISADNAILDGHHRKDGVIHDSGEETRVPVFMIHANENEALSMLKRVARPVSEAYSRYVELAALACLNGTFAESILRSRGFSESAIRRAVSIRLFTTQHGMVQSISPHLREAKLVTEFVPALAAAARVVGGAVAKKAAQFVAGQAVKHIANGNVSKLQVVKDEGDNVTAIDPENPAAGPQKLSKKEVALSDDEEDTEAQHSTL